MKVNERSCLSYARSKGNFNRGEAGAACEVEKSSIDLCCAKEIENCSVEKTHLLCEKSWGFRMRGYGNQIFTPRDQLPLL